ncbi:RICIN domain-containing protein [Microbispora sitophila]|uniref:RICIN domain-containing protein n=1 Tax=Microbispora sitophila TaxID=2771537 RepID=UPI001D00C8A8
MLEPWNDCTGVRPDQRFRLEPTGGDGYRIRPASSGRCLAVNGDDGEPGAEAVERPCASAAGQTFSSTPNSPPRLSLRFRPPCFGPVFVRPRVFQAPCFRPPWARASPGAHRRRTCGPPSS